jgi:hypothetical protein
VFVKLKNQPYPIWIRFVRVRHTGVYRVPHAVGRFHPTRTLLNQKTVQTTGIEPITADNLSSILSQRSHQIAASI